MHEEKLDIIGVLHKESLVARGHHVAGLLVATVADLAILISTRSFLTGRRSTYRGHGKVALEASADAVVDTLGLAPCRRDALEAVGLVAPETLGACCRRLSADSIRDSSVR